MGLRITTWNVNGIRNPFQYQPWRDKRTFEGMFEILEADIVVLQETKIQRKDLRDDMVLVPGWDCYWSLPKHKKGYSGVVIYTRNSSCAPIHAEEGITGVLCPPNSSTSFKDLPEDENIGGYPTLKQLTSSSVDPLTLDSEGRCVVLEFPLFVLFGVYSPAMRDESRDDFRLGFVNLLDARIRNLVAQGKRVILTGDLNIARDERDTANAEESMRKNNMTGQEYVSTPSRRLFNQLLVDGKVFGEREEGREQSVMWDVCRGFHPDRKGMFTCWETKINARPGNFGSRIDYVVCSADMKEWFSDSNIQEGLMGSDHCPVYAVLKDEVIIDDKTRDVRDMMNPPGMYQNGVRVQEWSTKNLLAMSGKLINEFDRRKSIKDMFSRKPNPLREEKSATTTQASTGGTDIPTLGAFSELEYTTSSNTSQGTLGPFPSPEALSVNKSFAGSKRPLKDDNTAPLAKRTKSGQIPPGKSAHSKGQQSLKGFFKRKPTPTHELEGSKESIPMDFSQESSTSYDDANLFVPTEVANDFSRDDSWKGNQSNENSAPLRQPTLSMDGEFVDPIVSKESWSKLFIKPSSPRCESHNEPCTSFVTKKPGINCGRSFWVCQRPLGPSGNKEKGTQWRCPTFIWASDWNSPGSGSSG